MAIFQLGKVCCLLLVPCMPVLLHTCNGADGKEPPACFRMISGVSKFDARNQKQSRRSVHVVQDFWAPARQSSRECKGQS